MQNIKWLNLQLFAGEGAGDGGGEAAATGENAVDPGQQRLLELGVPADKLRKRANQPAVKLPAGAVKSAPSQPEAQQVQEQAAAAENPAEEKTNTATRMSWDEIMADPEYNKEMQAVVQSRLRSAKGAEEALGKLTPALELLARQEGLDPENLDYDALAKAISNNKSYYEDKALEMGVSVETAMQIDQQERDTARKQREEERSIQDQKLQNRFNQITQQSEEIKKVFPNFDLQKEMKNKVFARMMAPDMPFSVEDAYYAVHRNEIQTASMQVAAQKAAQNISNSIQAGNRRPVENGTSGQAPSVTTFDYRNASPEQRAAIKALIRSEAAHGRKVYPGNYPGK